MTVPRASKQVSTAAVSAVLGAVVVFSMHFAVPAEEPVVPRGALLKAYSSSLPAEAAYSLAETSQGPLASFTVRAGRAAALISMNGHPLLFLDGPDTIDLVNLTRFDGASVQERVGLFVRVFSRRYREQFGVDPAMPSRLANVYAIALPLEDERPIPTAMLLSVPSGLGAPPVVPLWLHPSVQASGVELSGGAARATVGRAALLIAADGWLQEFAARRGDAAITVKRTHLRKGDGEEPAPPREALFAEDLSPAEPERIEVTALALAMRLTLDAAAGIERSAPDRQKKISRVCRSAFEALLAEYSVDAAAVQSAVIVAQFLKEKAPSLEGKAPETVLRVVEELIGSGADRMGRELSTSVLTLADVFGPPAGSSVDEGTLRAVMEGFSKAFAVTTGDRIGRAVRWRLRDFIRSPQEPAGGPSGAG